MFQMQLWESVKELQFLCERLDFIHIYSRHNARYTWWTRNFSRTSEKVAAWQIRRLAARGVRRFTARFDDKTRRQLVSPVDCQSVCLPFPVGVCLSVCLSVFRFLCHHSCRGSFRDGLGQQQPSPDVTLWCRLQTLCVNHESKQPLTV